MKPLLIGAHTSGAGGLYNALFEGREIGATTIQFFTANQRRWMHNPLERNVIEAFRAALKETNLKEIMSHDSYLINLGAPNEEILLKSRAALKEEIIRCQQLGVTYLNFHPGAAVGDTMEACLDRIVESLLEMAPLLKDDSLRLLLETTAGQGSVAGSKFEEIGYIIERVKDKLPIGVCIDTCHIFVAGYDIRTSEAWEETLQKFDASIGLKHLYAFHVNDSLKGLGSKVDRHRPLGKGEIGLPCFQFLMQDSRLKKLPKYLETPEPALWLEEIKMLRTFAEERK